MDYKFFYQSLLNILFTPGKAWDKIITENRSNKYLRKNFLYPLLAIVSLATFLGSVIFIDTSLSTFYSVVKGVRFFIVLLSVTYFCAMILGEITKPLDLGKDFTTSFRLIVYSLTPLFLSLIASQLFESLIFADILALYGLFIFWTGAEKILNPPDYKKMPLIVTITIVIIAVFFAFNWLVTSFSDRVFFIFFS